MERLAVAGRGAAEPVGLALGRRRRLLQFDRRGLARDRRDDIGDAGRARTRRLRRRHARARPGPAFGFLYRAALLRARSMDRLRRASGPTRADALVRGQFRFLVESSAVTSHDAAGVLRELLRAAAATRPDAIFARIGGRASDAPAALRAGPLDALADHYAARLEETELPQGTKLLLLSSPEPRTLATIVGALRAGFDVGLAAPALDAAAIAAAAEAYGAGVLAGPAAFAELQTGERLFEAAALLDSISLVALHGEGEAGAFALDAPREDDAPNAAPTREPKLLAIDIVDAAPKCRSVSQERTREVAREFLARAELREGGAIVSTISLGSE